MGIQQWIRHARPLPHRVLYILLGRDGQKKKKKKKANKTNKQYCEEYKEEIKTGCYEIE